MYQDKNLEYIENDFLLPLLLYANCSLRNLMYFVISLSVKYTVNSNYSWRNKNRAKQPLNHASKYLTCCQVIHILIILPFLQKIITHIYLLSNENYFSFILLLRSAFVPWEITEKDLILFILSREPMYSVAKIIQTMDEISFKYKQKI